MKFELDRSSGVNVVTGYAPGEVVINGLPWRHSVVLPWQGEIHAWPVASLAALTEHDVDALLPWRPELVLIGSGSQMRFAAVARMQGLIRARIGFETMDTAAACRTYNVLAGEGRKVVAALILDSP